MLGLPLFEDVVLCELSARVSFLPDLFAYRPQDDKQDAYREGRDAHLNKSAVVHEDEADDYQIESYRHGTDTQGELTRKRIAINEGDPRIKKAGRRNNKRAYHSVFYGRASEISDIFCLLIWR